MTRFSGELTRQLSLIKFQPSGLLFLPPTPSTPLLNLSRLLSESLPPTQTSLTCHQILITIFHPPSRFSEGQRDVSCRLSLLAASGHVGSRTNNNNNSRPCCRPESGRPKRRQKQPGAFLIPPFSHPSCRLFVQRSIHPSIHHRKEEGKKKEVQPAQKRSAWRAGNRMSRRLVCS